MLTEIKFLSPWWIKLAAKLLLSQFPLSYRSWQKLGLFRHGCMTLPEYALNVFESHVDQAGLRGHLRGIKILEIGPGDSVATAIIAKSYGAKAILIDAKPFAESDIRPYLALCELLRRHGLEPPMLSSSDSLQDILSLCEGEYLTEGLKGWNKIPPKSVDFVFSQAVLEHILKDEFFLMMQECRRVMKPGSFASHKIDLRDHLGEALNNLRFSEQVWESNLFNSSGFYTNRIRYTDMIKLFKAAGFSVEKTEVVRWDKLPNPKKDLALPFRNMSVDELCIKAFDVCLRVPNSLIH